MLRASHAVGRFVGLCFLCGFLRFARGFDVVLTLMTANWPLMVVNAFWLALLAMVVNALWV